MVCMTRRISLGAALGTVICERRRLRGLSQEGLGFASGLHRTSISLIERGRKSPTLETLTQIARALDTSTSKLVADAESLLSRPAHGG